MQNDIDSNTALLILACAGAINHDYLKLVELMNVQVQTLKRILGKRPAAPISSEHGWHDLLTKLTVMCLDWRRRL